MSAEFYEDEALANLDSMKAMETYNGEYEWVFNGGDPPEDKNPRDILSDNIPF